MGPSGSGKTTILRAIAGLEPFDERRDRVDGVTLTGGHAAPATLCGSCARKVGMVFQFHCLFEHLSALENVCLAPVHAHGSPRAAARGARAGAARGARRRAPRRRRCRASCPAAKRSASRSRARWPSIRRCC